MFSYEGSCRTSPKEIKEKKNQCFLRGEVALRKCFLFIERNYHCYFGKAFQLNPDNNMIAGILSIWGFRL